MRPTEADYETLPRRYSRRKTHLPYDVAKKLINEQAPHVTSAHKYRKYIKDTRSYYFPVHPERIYDNFDWSEFLDVETRHFWEVALDKQRRSRIVYRPMWDSIRWAQEYCKQKGIITRKQWEENYNQVNDIPEDIPKYPNRTYKSEKSDNSDKYPGFAVWCGRDITGIVQSIQLVTPIVTLLHPRNTPNNVVKLLTWPKGVGELRNVWPKQQDYDHIYGVWEHEKELVSQIDHIMANMGVSNGENHTVANLNALLWEFNSLLAIVKP